jgi:hypothetical protein
MAMTLDGSSGVTTNAGGLVNPSTTIDGINYSCRAWVNFNGTGTVAIRASGNVSSITDNGTGDYTVNFTTAITDANYTSVVSCSPSFASQVSIVNINTEQTGLTEVAPTTSAFRMVIRDRVGSTLDAKYVNVSVFR